MGLSIKICRIYRLLVKCFYSLCFWSVIIQFWDIHTPAGIYVKYINFVGEITLSWRAGLNFFYKNTGDTYSQPKHIWKINFVSRFALTHGTLLYYFIKHLFSSIVYRANFACFTIERSLFSFQKDQVTLYLGSFFVNMLHDLLKFFYYLLVLSFVLIKLNFMVFFIYLGFIPQKYCFI